MLPDNVLFSADPAKDLREFVLAKKYKYLRIAYNIFMYGLIIAILAFTISFLMPGATEVYGP